MTHNLAQCQIIVKKAAEAGAKALFLPEASDYIAANGEETVRLVRSVQESSFVKGLQREAQEKNIAINVGVHEPAQDGKKVKNTLLWIGENDIKGGPMLRESNSVEKSDRILPPFDTLLGKVGLMICFDLRFPEISLALRRQGAQVLTYPSAFTVPTGNAHWHALLRARAIETQSWVIAAAQVGRHNEKRTSFGHSVIIGPWGDIKAELGGESTDPEIATADLDMQDLERIRTEVPLIRRTDVYPEV